MVGEGEHQEGVMRQRIAILEPIAVFVLIMAYIWELRFRYHSSWTIILAFILLSHLLHHEGAESLGFRTRDFRQCMQEFLPVLVFVALLLVGAGILLHTTRPIRFGDACLAWPGYLPWGTVQQYLLNGYFLNRLVRVMPVRSAPVASAMLFSGAHLPNWFLMLVTLLAGYICARVYLRHKNLYFLGFAHATVGFLLFLVVPDSISHHLVVGPGWFGR
jgi:Type II CAAX prenyl endopeptidase Rce1-like